MNEIMLKDNVVFYHQGEALSQVSCKRFDFDARVYDFYLLKNSTYGTCEDNSSGYEYYNANGENVFGKTFSSASSFSKYGYAIVSEDGKKYYLINKKGEVASAFYDGIHITKNGYYSTEKDGLEGLMDSTGKEIFPCQYLSLAIAKEEKNQKRMIAKVELENQQLALYQVATKKEIVRYSKSQDISFYEFYIKVTDGDKLQYYSYTTGKLIFEE